MPTSRSREASEVCVSLMSLYPLIILQKVRARSQHLAHTAAIP